MFVVSARNVDRNPVTRAAAKRVARRVERKERIERITAWSRAMEEQVMAHRLARRAVEERIAAMAAGSTPVTDRGTGISKQGNRNSDE